MKIVVKETNQFLLRFDRGEDVIAGLAAFAKEARLGAAHFSALGAAEKVALSFYNGARKRYEDSLIRDALEIVSLSGNIAWQGDEPTVHAHGVFSDRQFKTVGGHVKKCVVAFTCEVSLFVFGKKVLREHDEQTGLNLLS